MLTARRQTELKKGEARCTFYRESQVRLPSLRANHFFKRSGYPLPLVPINLFRGSRERYKNGKPRAIYFHFTMNPEKIEKILHKAYHVKNFGPPLPNSSCSTKKVTTMSSPVSPGSSTVVSPVPPALNPTTTKDAPLSKQSRVPRVSPKRVPRFPLRLPARSQSLPTLSRVWTELFWRHLFRGRSHQNPGWKTRCIPPRKRLFPSTTMCGLPQTGSGTRKDSCHHYVDAQTHRCYIQKALSPQEIQYQKRNANENADVSGVPPPNEALLQVFKPYEPMRTAMRKVTTMRTKKKKNSHPCTCF